MMIVLTYNTDIPYVTMNCFENNDTVYQFVDTVSKGDKLVLYPRHIPRSDAETEWGQVFYYQCNDSVVLDDDERDPLHGNSPVFVEVLNVSALHRTEIYMQRTVYFKDIPVSTRMILKMYIIIKYIYATDVWECSILAKNYTSDHAQFSCMSPKSYAVSTRTKIYYASSIGMVRRDAFCENILAASTHRIKRDMMREVFSKKLGDERAVEMIAYSFFPVL